MTPMTATTPDDLWSAWTSFATEGAQTLPNSTLCFLLDWGVASGGPEPAWLSQHTVFNLFDNTPDAAHRHLAPRLVLPASDDLQPLLKRLAALETKEPCVHWLWARETGEHLSQRLTHALNGRLPDGGESLVRYFDRAIWFFLRDQLDEAQRRHVLGGVASWDTWENGAWASVAVKEAYPPSPEPLHWTKQQVEAINLAALPMQLYEDLKADYPDRLHKGTRQQAEALFAQACRRAYGWQVRRYKDFVLFALLALRVNPDFDQHPDVAKALAQVKSGHMPLPEAIDQVPAQAWVDLGDELRENVH